MEPTDASKLQWAILEYLSAQRTSGSANATQAQALGDAISSLESSFGLSLADATQKAKFSSEPLDLASAFSYALKHKDSAVAAAPKSDTAAEVEDPVLREKFDRYIDLLAKRGFFNGCEKGSDEYNDRVSKAKSRFLSKYAQEQQEAAAAASSSSAPAPAPTAASTPKNAGLSEAEKTEKAEALKNDGNSKLASRQFNEAIALYSEAITLNPRNAIFYSNRAAAYSHIGEHQKAISDCNAAIKLDPKYSKAYSRLGLAYFSLGKYREAVEFGYRKALELEPNNATARESLAAAEAKIAESEAASQAAPTTMPEMPGMPGMPGMGAGGNPLAGLNPDLIRQAMGAFGGGAGGAPGGMPDMGGLAGLMSNPQFASMAQNLMSNPAFMNMAQNLASNPDILRSFGSMFGGQPPAGGNNGNNDDDAMNM